MYSSKDQAFTAHSPWDPFWLEIVATSWSQFYSTCFQDIVTVPKLDPRPCQKKDPYGPLLIQYILYSNQTSWLLYWIPCQSTEIISYIVICNIYIGLLQTNDQLHKVYLLFNNDNNNNSHCKETVWSSGLGQHNYTYIYFLLILQLWGPRFKPSSLPLSYCTFSWQ